MTVRLPSPADVRGQLEGGMIRLETLIELKFIDSSCSSLSSYCNDTNSSLSSNSRQRYLSQRYPPPSCMSPCMCAPRTSSAQSRQSTRKHASRYASKHVRTLSRAGTEHMGTTEGTAAPTSKIHHRLPSYIYIYIYMYMYMYYIYIYIYVDVYIHIYVC